MKSCHNIMVDFCFIFDFIQQVKHEVAIRLVLVDIIATKEEELAEDLTAEDFEVKEDDNLENKGIKFFDSLGFNCYF
ncbi:MAG: hypothetical protein WBE11_09430 [Candidatus Aminicenantaceae bacterium]|jgi:hypothetical protein